MNRISLLAMAFWLGSCSTHSRGADCTLPALKETELNKIVQEEIKKRGGDPSVSERSSIKVKRGGCDYIYYLVHRPKRPSGYLFVRINQNGQIVDWIPGL
jgi:hypothetical protein